MARLQYSGYRPLGVSVTEKSLLSDMTAIPETSWYTSAGTGFLLNP